MPRVIRPKTSIQRPYELIIKSSGRETKIVSRGPTKFTAIASTHYEEGRGSATTAVISQKKIQVGIAQESSDDQVEATIAAEYENPLSNLPHVSPHIHATPFTDDLFNPECELGFAQPGQLHQNHPNSGQLEHNFSNQIDWLDILLRCLPNIQQQPTPNACCEAPRDPRKYGPKEEGGL